MKTNYSDLDHQAIEMKVAEARGGSMGDPPASADSSIADVRKSVRKVAKSNQILLKNMVR